MADEKRRAAAKGRGGAAGAARGAGKGASGAKGREAAKTAAKGAARGRGAGAGEAGAAKGRGNAAARKRAMDAIGSTQVRDRARLSERMALRTRLRLFVQSSVFDFLLVLLVSVALVFTVSFGFHSAWDYRGNVGLITAMVAPVLLALYAGSWSKRAVAVSAAATVVVAVAVVAVAVALSPEPLFTDAGISDTPGSYGIFAMIAVAVPVVVFLLSRRTVGLVFLLLASVLACGVIQFLYREWIVEQPGIPAAVAVMFGLGMMFVYQCYRQSVYSANRVKRTSFLGAFAFSALVGAVCVLVGAGVFYGVVAATDLTTPEVKLFESYVSPPVSDQARDYERMSIQGDETSDNTGEETDDTGEQGEGESAVQSGQAMLESTIVGRLAMQFAGVSPSVDDEDSDLGAQDWQLALQLMWLIYLVLALVVVVAFLVFWRRRREMRLRRAAKRSNAYQAWYLYTFLLERFRRVGIRKPAQLTPLEFAVSAAKAMHPYTRDAGGVDFVEVTSLYQDAAFGGYEPSDDEIERVRGYYRAFYKNAFKATPWPKWVFWRFWRL